MQDKQTKANGNETPEGKKPHTPDGLELTKTQSQIVQLIADWHPDSQRRVLNATGVLLGVHLGPAPKQPPTTRGGRP